MAIKSKAQIQAESNSTYVDNSVGAITPNSVRGLNTDWIDSTLFEEATGSLTVFGATSASFAQSASRAITAANATTASFTVSSSFATSASFATTAIVTPNAYSSASQEFGANTLTLFKRDSTTILSGDIFTINNVQSATLASTASLAVRNLITASAQANIITFTKGDGTTFTVTVAQSGSVASASYADVANQANFATSASNALTASFTPNAFVSAETYIISSSIKFSTGDGLGTFIVVDNVQSASYADNANTANSATNSTSASYAVSSSFAVTASYALNVPNTASFAISASRAISSETASFVTGVPTLAGNNTFNGTNAFNNAVTMSNVLVTGTASIAFLDVTFQSSSIIYSSGSNQFGDASNDTQTLFGTVNIATGPLVVTGSANFKETITGSISTALSSTSASFATNAATASFLLGTVASASFAISASRAISAATATSASYATEALYAGSTTSSLSSSAIYVENFSGNANPFYLTFANNYTGDWKRLGAASNLTYTPATNVLSATVSNATSAASASSLFTENYNGINSTYYLTMVDNAAGFKRYGLDTDLAYNPSTNILSATVTAAASASSITIDNYNGSNTTYYLTMVDNAAGFKRVGLDTDLAYNPSTNLLSGLITSASFATSASRAISAASATSATTATTASSVTSLDQTVTITGSVNVSGSITIAQNDKLIAHDIQAANVAGIEINNNTGNTVALFGAGGSQGTTFYGQVNGTAFSGSGALIYGVVSSSYALTASYVEGAAAAAFPFTGSAGISGSLNVVGALYVPSGSFEITGSATINSGSLVMFSYKNVIPSNRSFQALVTQSLNSTNNIISISQGTAQSGSIVISGSGNYISLNSVQTNASYANGATSGFFGQNAYVTILPITTGSNPNFNTTADRNSRAVPSVLNSNVNAAITINDSRGSESSVPVTISNSSVNKTATFNIQSGSLSISNSQLLGSTGIFVISGSGTNAQNASIANSIMATTTNSTITFNATSSQTSAFANSILVGANIRVSLTGSTPFNSTSVAAPSLIDSAIIGRHLIVTGSSNSGTTTTNIAVFGAHNTADGLLNDGRFTKFAIGTGASDASRSTAFHVSASGMTTANIGLNVRGVQTGETELEVRATGVKIGNLITDSHNLTGSFAISGSQLITGSLIGQPISQSVSSNTASLDLRLGNFFNLTLPASTNTYVTASGQVPGQTINLKITQGATTGSVTFGSGIKQVSGSAYTATTTANAVDIVTFISFDETGLYMSNVKNLI